MKKLKLIFLICIIFLSHGFSQNTTIQDPLKKAVVNMYAQILVQPEEKIYVQTDRPYYLNGEKLFFRVFLLSASTLKRADWSRYVYVELVSPVDTVVVRQQIKLQEDKMFYGNLDIPESLPEGNYKLRAYTRYMGNEGEEFYFTKPIFIADPNASKTDITSSFDYINDRQVMFHVNFRDIKSQSLLSPELLTFTQYKKKSEKLEKPNSANGYEERFDLDDNNTSRIILLEFKNSGRTFKKYIIIPYQSGMPEVTFYPEGGQMIAGLPNKIAFKSLLQGGLPSSIDGNIVNSKNEKIASFSTLRDGMGFFSFTPSADDMYYAQCTYNGQNLNIKLPAAQANGYSLHTQWEGDSLSVHLLQNAPSQTSTYYLVVHHQGIPVYFQPWDFSKKEVKIKKELFVTGVSHVLLLNGNFKAISERLVFNNNNDQLHPEITTNETEYHPRGKVVINFKLPVTASDSIPPTFAISVTDDSDVKLDTTTNIISEVLLSSELKGNIVNPAWYFSSDKKVSETADLLMMTNGWRSYNIKEALQNNLQKPPIKPEQSQAFSGVVKGRFGRLYKNGKVQMMAVGYHYTTAVETDEKGNFDFDDFEFPDSTAYFFMCYTDKSKLDDIMELKLDPIEYPAVTQNVKPIFFPSLLTKSELADFSNKANAKYLNEYGMRQIDLPEVTVKAKMKDTKRHLDNRTGNLDADLSLLPDEIEQTPPSSYDDLFMRLPGVTSVVPGEGVKVRNQNCAFVLNGIPLKCTYGELPQYVMLSEIGQLDLYRDITKTMMFSSSGTPTIAITTWPPGENIKKQLEELTNRKMIMPLGFQTPIAFYSPRYDNPEALNDKKADLRTTIYWKPNLTADSQTGKSSIDFYTADTPGTYSLVIEGFNNSKKFIFSRDKAIIRVKK